jgi:hypothetical protein
MQDINILPKLPLASKNMRDINTSLIIRRGFMSEQLLLKNFVTMVVHHVHAQFIIVSQYVASRYRSHIVRKTVIAIYQYFIKSYCNIPILHQNLYKYINASPKFIQIYQYFIKSYCNIPILHQNLYKYINILRKVIINISMLHQNFCEYINALHELL